MARREEEVKKVVAPLKAAPAPVKKVAPPVEDLDEELDEIEEELDEETEEVEEEVEEKAPKKAKATKPAKEAKAAKEPEVVDPNLVTLKMLAADIEVEARKIRIFLRGKYGAGNGRWEWMKGDKVIQEVKDHFAGKDAAADEEDE